jgi:hypothetical protein
MSENLARCPRCHDVFDPELGVCPRCGTPYQPIPAPPPPEAGTYADLYAATEFAVPVDAGPAVEPSHGPSIALLAGGAGLLATAVLIVVLVASGAFSAPPGQPPIIVSLSPTGTPTLSPTIRPEIAMTLSALNDKSVNTHVVIESRIDEDSTVTGRPFSHVATFDCQLSSGEEQCILTGGGGTEEIRYTDGLYFVRTLPKGKWTTTSTVPAYVVIVPLFEISTPKMLEFVGDEMRDGQQTYHFKTTRMWVPNLNKMAMTDANALGMKPDTVSMDLWTSTFGKPIYASFSGTTLAIDGKRLLDIETTYTFSDFGVPVDVVNPLATPTPKPTPTPAG